MDYIEKAEKAIQELCKNHKGNIALTVSQIRKFLTAVNSLRNQVDNYKFSVLKDTKKNPEKLPSDLAMEIKFLRVNILYQAARERTVEDFVKKADLKKQISDIGDDINKFYQFCRYMEALVAFHKFYGGKDN